MDDDRVIINLKHQIPYKEKDGKELMLGSIELCMPRAKHLKLLPKSVFSIALDEVDDNGKKKKKKMPNISPSDILPLIAGMANLPLATIDELSLEDLFTVADKVTELVEKYMSPGTGES